MTLKKMKKSDIPLLLKWFKMDHIREYWFSIRNKTENEIVEKYTKRLKEGKIETFIICHKNTKIGLIQTYILEDTSQFHVEGLSKGIDLFIGDTNYLNRGFGTNAIRELLVEYVFDDNSIINACIDPEVRNSRAIRAYEKVGFKHVNTEVEKNSGLLTYFMVLERNDFFKI